MSSDRFSMGQGHEGCKEIAPCLGHLKHVGPSNWGHHKAMQVQGTCTGGTLGSKVTILPTCLLNKSLCSHLNLRRNLLTMNLGTQKAKSLLKEWNLLSEKIIYSWQDKALELKMTLKTIDRHASIVQMRKMKSPCSGGFPVAEVIFNEKVYRKSPHLSLTSLIYI